MKMRPACNHAWTWGWRKKSGLSPTTIPQYCTATCARPDRDLGLGGRALCLALRSVIWHARIPELRTSNRAGGVLCAGPGRGLGLCGHLLLHGHRPQCAALLGGALPTK
eukprot:scaffold272235_cov19-Tisochrysis_lutea.AAC.2